MAARPISHPMISAETSEHRFYPGLERALLPDAALINGTRKLSH